MALSRPRLTLAAVALLATVGASPGSAQVAFSSHEKPFATISRMFLKRPIQDSLVELARSQVGLRYQWGAKAPGKAFDCSGLVQWVMEKLDFSLPRTSRAQARLGTPVAKDPDQLLPGDLLFFGRGKSINHVGIYVGDGKFVHAANRKEGIVEDSLPTGREARTWWKSVRRLFPSDSLIPWPTDVGPLLKIG